ncbi:MAG: transposase [Pseudomonadota bacterium]
MPRLARILPSDAMVHLIGRSNNSMRLFHDADDFTRFRNTILRYLKDRPIFIHHYVFMHTHFHLLAWVEGTSCLASVMKAIAVSYNHYHRRRYRFYGHIWHSRFRSIVIEDEAHWSACGRYIEINPVRAGICHKPEKYPWSSYRHYAFGREDVLLNPVKGRIGCEDWLLGRGSLSYREFVQAGITMDQTEMRKLYSKK